MIDPYTSPSVPITIPPDAPSKISASTKRISCHALLGLAGPNVWCVFVILPTVAVSWKPSGEPITATISPTSALSEFAKETAGIVLAIGFHKIIPASTLGSEICICAGYIVLPSNETFI